MKKFNLFFCFILLSLITITAILVFRPQNSTQALDLKDISSIQITSGTRGHSQMLKPDDKSFVSLLSALDSKDIMVESDPGADNGLNGYLFSIRLFDSSDRPIETLTVIDTQTLSIEGHLYSLDLSDIIDIITLIE